MMTRTQIRAEAALILFVASYLAEVIRAGLQALPKGQTEAAHALGLAAHTPAAGAARGDPGTGQPRYPVSS